MVNTTTVGRQKQYKEAVERKNSNRDFPTAVKTYTGLDVNDCVLFVLRLRTLRQFLCRRYFIPPTFGVPTQVNNYIIRVEKQITRKTRAQRSDIIVIPIALMRQNNVLV